MAYDGLSRISVCVLDESGLLQIRGEDGHYSGVLPRPPAALSVGDTAHLRMSVPLGAHEVEAVDVLGTVVLLEGGPGPVALREGLIFELSVSHVSRRAEMGAPPPVDVVVGEELPADEPLESPIHFAPPSRVDVERREASYDPAKLYAPVPLSLPDEPAVEEDDVELDEEKLRAAAAERARVLRERFAEEQKARRAQAAAAHEQGSGAHEAPAVHDEDAASASFDPAHEDATAHHRSGSRHSARAVYEATEPSGVVGTLREMSLTEVVQSLGFSGKTAEVDIRPKGVDLPPGVVFLERGNVVYARCGTLEGEEAFFALADLKRGAFLIRFHAKAPTTNVHSPTAFLLLEALRRKDEENHERDLVEAVAEEVAEEVAAEERAAALQALEGATSDGLDDADRTVLSGTISFDDEALDAAFAEVEGVEPPPAREVATFTPEEVELDEAAMEEALVAVEPAYDDLADLGADDDERKRPYATAIPTTIFSRFFEEASEGGEAADSGEGEGDDFADPTFSNLKAALQGLKGGEDDTLAAFDEPLRSGSFPSYS